MFTGIIETLGKVSSITRNGTNLVFTIESSITSELKVDQSVSHNGVCLTVEAIEGAQYRVTAVKETLLKSNFGLLKPGDAINLERSLRAGDRMDGHFVYGHVDATGTLVNISDRNGSYNLTFTYPHNEILVEKGSIAVNGISLTVFDVTPETFTVAIIPYTWENTNLGSTKEGSTVNLEFDILGKYIREIQRRQII